MSYKKINETKVYKLAFELAMKIFEISRTFPKEEHILLLIRYDDRVAVFVLVWQRRTGKDDTKPILFQRCRTPTWKMPKHKHGCSLLSHASAFLKMYTNDLLHVSEQVGNLLNHMIINPEKYR